MNRPQLFTVEKLMKAVSALVTNKIYDEQIGFSIEGALDTLEVHCKPVDLVHALCLLINNSIDAVEQHPEKWIKVVIQNEGKFIEFAITDSSQGQETPPLSYFLGNFVKIAKARFSLKMAERILKSHQGSVTFEKTASFTRYNAVVPRGTPVS